MYPSNHDNFSAQAGRFEKPRPVQPWPGVYDATTERDSCPQQLMVYAPSLQNEKMSEDCFYLNVWKPAEEKSAPRSVMFYIYGGGFTIGTIFAPLSDGRYIASRGDVIVVAANYRVGPFGFLFGGDVPPNLGLHDQIFALRWVKENIGQFGGNPEDITIFGLSAGSMSVSALILSPLAKGLFRRAILQGGAVNSQMGASSPSVLEALTKQFARRLNCPTDDPQQMVDCLRGKSATELASANTMDFAKMDFLVPVYGDEVLPEAPLEALKLGQFNRDIDVLFGTASDEGSSFVAGMFPKLLQETGDLTVESTKRDIVHMIKEGWKPYNQAFAEQVAEYYTKHLTNPTQDELK